jgi:hypothetical protein
MFVSDLLEHHERDYIARVFSEMVGYFQARGAFGPLRPILLLQLQKAQVLFTADKTAFRDSRNRAIWALQGICIPLFYKPHMKLALPYFLTSHIGLLDTWSTLEFKDADSIELVTSDQEVFDISVIGPSVWDQMSSMSFPHVLDASQSGFDSLVAYVASANSGFIQFAFAVPNTITQYIAEAEFILAPLADSGGTEKHTDSAIGMTREDTKIVSGSLQHLSEFGQNNRVNLTVNNPNENTLMHGSKEVSDSSQLTLFQRLLGKRK